MPRLPSTMTVVEISRPGGPEVLTPVNRPVLPPEARRAHEWMHSGKHIGKVLLTP